MIAKLQRAYQLLNHFGPEWLLFRTKYALEMRAGILKAKTPVHSWEDQPLTSLIQDESLALPERYWAYRRSGAPAFFFSPSDRVTIAPHLTALDVTTTSPVALAGELEHGVMRYFEHAPLHTGFPPDWHTNPFTSQTAPATRHWSEIQDFDYGDIKAVWEPSRFAFAYTLVRAFWRTGNEKYAELFWRVVEDWRVRNPPQQGPNWKCGQETSFRVMAWCFALYGFLDSPATTPGRVAMLTQMIAISGRRIAANIGYALSQNNNHGISEAMGLWTISLLFPELREAEQWHIIGRRELEQQARDLVYDDGAFSQHSLNYHRVMLQDYLWAIRLGTVNDQPLSQELVERVRRAGEFIYQLQDSWTGAVPCYGANDGALVLPLNNCAFWDMRPVVQAVMTVCSGKRRFDSGPWDEDMLWLVGADAYNLHRDEHPRTDLCAEAGGYYTLRGASGFAFIRCGQLRHRPSHADALHADIWWRGQNIALDPGTYSYNAPPPWDRSLERTRFHNTVTVDGEDQMQRVGRFLWLPWVQARVIQLGRGADGRVICFEGEHDGFAHLPHLPQPVRYARMITRLDEDSWLVLDRVSSATPHALRAQWLLPDVPYDWDRMTGRIVLHTPMGSYAVTVTALHGPFTTSLVRADEHSPRGWRAIHYNTRQPALSLDVRIESRSTIFCALFGPPDRSMTLNGNNMSVECDGSTRVFVLSDQEHAPVATPLLRS